MLLPIKQTSNDISIQPSKISGSGLNLKIIIMPPVWNKILDGNYNDIQITFNNQNYNSIQTNDNDIVLVLSVVDSDDGAMK